MKVIKDFVIRGVIPPLKRNLVLRFTKGGGAQETMRDTLIMEKRGYQNSWKEEDLLVSHTTFLLLCVGDRAFWRLRSCCINHLISFFWQLPRMLWMDKTFIKFHANVDSFYWCETSRPKWALAWVKVTFSWIDPIGWVHKIAREIITTWLESRSTPCRVLAQNQQYMSTNRSK
jgi:hypothetical protein